MLGANDGLISTGSLVVGIAAAEPSREAILLTAVAGLVAGVLSMAAGEYVSVGSQADTETADLAREKRELTESPALEHAELTGIYQSRGLSPELAAEVARALAAHDALGAHARDELGMSEGTRARPIQAAPPVLLAALLPPSSLTLALVAMTLVLLAGLGALAARLGSAPVLAGTVRVAFWGAVAMGVTLWVGRLFGGVTV